MKKKRKKLKWVLIILAVIAVIVVYLISQGKKAVDNMYSSITAEKSDFSVYYTFSGNTALDETERIVTTQTWKIDSITVKEGETIKAGETLYVINEEDYNMALYQAEAAIENAKIALSSTESSTRQQINQAKSSMNTAKMSMEDAKATLDDTQALYEAGIATKQTYDQAKLAYDMAQEQYNSARDNYNTLANTTSGLSISSAEAQLEQAQKSYDSLIKQVGDREVKAETDGTISKIYVDPGVKLNAGTVVMDILDTNSIKAIVKVDEYDYSTMQIGTEVIVRIDALDLEVPGKVTSIDLQATAGAGISYFNTEISFEHDDRVLGGMTVEVKALKGEALDAIILPIEVIQFDKTNQAYILYKDENGNMLNRNVTIGVTDGLRAEIVEGITEGETIYYIDNSAYYQMMEMMGGN